VQEYNSIEADIDRVLISRERIARRVDELALQIAGMYAPYSEGLTIVAVLAGALIFAGDLIRRLPLRMRIGLLMVSSYTGTSGGQPRIVFDAAGQIRGRHVLVVDDILDSGRTMQTVLAELGRHEPASLRSCVLLRKVDKAPERIHVDFVGFDIDDVFVVGYGLDYNDQYRNWPDIVVLRPELYQ